jgi:orotate phosphoribosyltransferase
MESGHHADVWLELETLCVRPATIQPFAADLATRIRPYDVDVVCGPLNEGAFIALMVAFELDCEFAYAERVVNPTSEALFPVDYPIPPALHPIVRGRRVAIVNDVISAGSAVRGAFASLQALDARVAVIAALLVFGRSILTFARERDVPLEVVEEQPGTLWAPAECPLCRSGLALDKVGV